MLKQGLKKYLQDEQLHKLSNTCVGIAGVGGLGSNCALLLARSGVSNFLLIDDDTVDASNLNRQYYMPKHVGMLKVDALEQILLELNPEIIIEKQALRLDENNINPLLAKAAHWVEALDDAATKRLFVEHTMQNELFTVSASGICGYGGPPMQQKNMGKCLVLVGDFSSDMQDYPPLAPRVMQAAAMQADAMLAHILG